MMCKSGHGYLSRLESRIPIVIGGIELLVSLLILIAASILRVRTHIHPSWLPDLLMSLGVGLFAAGAVTAVLEPITRKRHIADVDEVKQAHFESILRGLMPGPIFEQVQAQIIQQPFVRKNVRVSYELEWGSPARETILNRLSSSYDVVNISRTEATHEMHVILEDQIVPAEPGFTGVQEISVTRDSGVVERFSHEELSEKTTIAGQIIQVRLPIKLAPREKARVTMRAKSVVSDHVQILTMSSPTINLDLAVNHPPDMIVKAVALHPNIMGLEDEVGGDRSKRWRLETGLLPFQGLELSHVPKPVSTAGDDCE